MGTYTKHLVLALFILVNISAYSQNLEKKKIKAESSFFLEKFDKALLEYQELAILDPSFKTAAYRMEICSLLVIDPHKSLDLIKSYAKTQGRKDKFYHYWMALIYFKREEYKNTIDACDRFLVVNKYKTREIRTEIHTLRKQAELIYLYKGQPEAFAIEHLKGKMNSKHNEYSPVYFKEREAIMFMSSHRRLGGNQKKEVFHIFESRNLEDHWHSPKHIHHLGSYEGNVTSISVKNETGRLFVYSDNKGGELFFSEPKGHTWHVTKEYDEKIITSKIGEHFYINAEETKVLFSKITRNEKDKTENLDIYQSTRNEKTGVWSSPLMLSLNINSDKDEDYPYLTSDGQTLYFSSRGHESIGGYDIFKSEYNNMTKDWSEPVALRNPFNTIDDEFQITLNDDQISGYFVSNREGTTGGFDIYGFKELNKVYVEGRLTNNLEEPIAQADIKILMPTEEEPDFYKKTITDGQGVFRLGISTEEVFDIEVFLGDSLIHRDKLHTPKYDVNNTPLKVHFIPAELN